MDKYSDSGNIFVITAPSGTGKSSLVKALIKHFPSLSLSVSCTTRDPRPGEKEAQDYQYITIENFEKMLEKKMLLEWAKIHGNFYGTPRDSIDKAILNGNDILLEIDWQGTRQIKKNYPKAITIFVLPPSIEELKNRLITRAQDQPQVINKRLSGASYELAHAAECEYIIINEDFNVALFELVQIINVSRLKFSSQATRNFSLFYKLGIFD
ncbi:MAG: guanylate kinase [Bordetella sp.]|nr:MAG: guanylate kinase [Bordetella sp.]